MMDKFNSQKKAKRLSRIESVSDILGHLNWVFGPKSTFCDLDDENLGDISLERLIKNYEYIYNPYGLYDSFFTAKREKGEDGVSKKDLEFLCHLSLFWNAVTLSYLNFFLNINRIQGLNDLEKNILIELSFLGSVPNEMYLMQRLLEHQIKVVSKKNFKKAVMNLKAKGYIVMKKYSANDIVEMKKRFKQASFVTKKGESLNSFKLNLPKIMDKTYIHNTILENQYSQNKKTQEAIEFELKDMIMGPKSINVTEQIENLRKLILQR